MYGVCGYKNDDELMHYGVLGMKWGVRKYGQRQVDKYVNKAKKYAYKAPSSASKFPNGLNLDAKRAENYAKAATYAEKAKGKGSGVERLTSQYNKQSLRVANRHLKNLEKFANAQLKVERKVDSGKMSPERGVYETQKLMSKMTKQSAKAVATQEKIKQGRDWMDNHPTIVNAQYKGMQIGTLVGGIPGSVAGQLIGVSVGKYKENH